MYLREVVELANAANYLDMPRLRDATLAAIALHHRRAVYMLEKSDGGLLQVTRDDDKDLRQQFN